MTNEQILKKAIEKAIKNGFNFDMNWDFRLAFNNRLGRKSVFPLYYAIIFSHDFAKAFWGEEFANCDKCGAGNIKDCYCLGDAGLIDSWQYHLQQMVLEEDPIKYLEQFI